MEMLVVVIILGILASIAMPQYQQAVYKARYVKIIPLVNSLRKAEEEYWLTHRRYTYDFSTLGFGAQGFSSAGSSGSEGSHNRASTLRNRRGDAVLQIQENGGGTPIVAGYLTRGGSTIGYVVYLDKNDRNGTNTSAMARKWCYSYTTDAADWRYKLCTAVTGARTPQENWEGPTRFQFPK